MWACTRHAPGENHTFQTFFRGHPTSNSVRQRCCFMASRLLSGGAEAAAAAASKPTTSWKAITGDVQQIYTTTRTRTGALLSAMVYVCVRAGEEVCVLDHRWLRDADRRITTAQTSSKQRFPFVAKKVQSSAASLSGFEPRGRSALLRPGRSDLPLITQ